MDPVPTVILSGAVSWPWVGVFCTLFFLCGGIIAWILGYHAGRLDGLASERKGRADDDQPQVLG
jgi:membrane protein YqaA with SNARE-associated domain